MLVVRHPQAPLGAYKMNAARALFSSAARLGPYAPRRSAAWYHRTAPSAVLEDLVTAPADNRLSPEPPRPAVLPGEADRQNFRLHWSVDMWRDFSPAKWLEGVNDDSAPLSSRLSAFSDTLTNALSTAGIFGSGEAAAYWGYHLARSGFFATQAVLALAAARANAGSSNGTVTRFQAVARSGWQGPLTEAMLQYYQDFECIKEGKYILPWDMTTATHRQFNPLFIARRAVDFVREASDTLRRREAGAPGDVWLRSSLLPEYFQPGFHYQSDGWLSQNSARVYETSTETLFVGRQDAMQRLTLLPVAEFMAGKDASQVRALEVGCGTGRFATFVKDNYPALELTLADLSPFYLAEARSNLRYWREQRAAQLALPGVDRNGCTFLQTPAEALAAPDASFDLVYSVYLFHELPPEVRAAAAAEMARVVKPGGLVVLTDSMQLGDRSAYNDSMGSFGDFQEPYYRSYIAQDLGALFQSVGLECEFKALGSTSKMLSFRKPLAAQEPASIPEAVAASEPIASPAPPAGGVNLN